MSKLLANTISITRFTAELAEKGSVPVQALVENLSRQGFRSIDNTADQESIGWVTATDPAVSDFEDSGLVYVDRFLFFSLRRDVRRVPSAVLKKNVKDAEDEWLAEHPNLKRVPKQVREQIRDTHHLALLSRTIPAPAVYDIVWDTERNEILLLASSGKVIDMFDTLFRKTYPGSHLRMLTPYHYAEHAVAGTPLSELLQKQNLAGSDTTLDLIKSNSWIGREFLLWLLSGAAEDSGPDRVSTWIDNRVALAGENVEGVEKVVVTGNIADTQNPVRAALRDGRHVVSATIHIEKDEESWRLNLVGENFSISSFRTPPVILEEGEQVDEAGETQAAHLEKVHMIKKGVDLFSSLLRAFLNERLEPGEWDLRKVKIEEWLNAS